jgi:uncharacterized protein YjiS (DUF1127 family)
MDATNFLSPPRRSRAADRLARAAGWLGACLERSRQRRDLAWLSDDLLKDIGLSRADVARECGRWPWDGRARALCDNSFLPLEGRTDSPEGRARWGARP